MPMGKRIKGFLGAVLTALLLVSLTASAFAAPAGAADKAGSTVRVGFFEFGGMFEGASENADKGGYCYEYMMQAAIYTGWSCEFVYGSYAELYEMLKNGEIDILPYTNYNEQRGTEVLFSDAALAEEEYYLAVRPESADVTPTEVLDGAEISTIEGADYNSLLLDYIEKNGIDCTVRYYPDVNETWDALRNGYVDATVFTSNAYSDDDWDCVCTFGTKPTYVAFAKERGDLLEQFNEAADLISREEPAFMGELYEKYFSDNPMRRSLTQDEQAWIDSHPVLHVGGFSNDAPYIFSFDNETKTASGLTPDVVNGIIERLEINASADYRAYATLAEMEDALDRGEIDVIIPFYPDYYTAQQHNLIVSNTVRVSNMELVYKSGTPYSDAVKKIATPATKLGIFYVHDVFPDAEIIGADSIQDAVNRVLSGEADGAVAQNVVMHNIMEKYDGLDYIVLSEGCGTCFATRPENYQLIRIINKGLNFFSSSEISAISSQYTLEPNVTTREYLATHREAVAMIAVIIVALLALIAALVQVSRLKIKADAANMSKTAFLFNMSHDIRTPMNAITGYTAMAKRHIDDREEVESYLNKIEVSGSQLLMLINEVLDMSRIDSGKIERREIPVDLVDRAHAMHTIVDSSARAKDISFKCVIDNLAHRYAFTDDEHLSQVVLNLIGNAVKYTPEGGSVTYLTTEEETGVPGQSIYVIKIIDNGIGMGRDFLKHVFEPFTREKSTTASGIQGTGLGMSIVKNLVAFMDGTVEIESEKGEGTTVTVRLPLRWAEKEMVEEQKHGRVPENFTLKGRKILLVEDNEMNREIACDLLGDAGAEVETAADGKIAVEMMKSLSPGYFDCILMDIQMPVMDGFEATRQIRALRNGVQDIPIIAMTANAFEEDRRASLDAGMNEHIAKPIDVPKLKETLSRFL